MIGWFTPLVHACVASGALFVEVETDHCVYCAWARVAPSNS